MLSPHVHTHARAALSRRTAQQELVLNQTYTVEAQRLSGIIAQQLQDSRVTGISGTDGVVVYTDSQAYFAVLRNSSGAIVKRNAYSEGLQGLLENTVKKLASADIEKIEEKVEYTPK